MYLPCFLGESISGDNCHELMSFPKGKSFKVLITRGRMDLKLFVFAPYSLPYEHLFFNASSVKPTFCYDT